MSVRVISIGSFGLASRWSCTFTVAVVELMYEFKKGEAVNVARTGRPKKQTEQVSLRVEKTTIGEIDELRRMEKDLPSRPEMIRRVIARYLEQHKKKR